MGNIFKAYDIRGVYPEEINEDLAFRVGGATAKFLNAKTMVIGEDARRATPELRDAVIDAVKKAGVKVYYIGQCTTPLFYYSVNKLKADGGIMVTASHNPPQYGGLKIVGKNSRPIGAETGLKEIEKLSQQEVSAMEKTGIIEKVNLIGDYVDFAIKTSKISRDNLKSLKLVIDASNGMKSLVLKPALSKLNIEYKPLYFEIDGTFPNHSSDITKKGVLDELAREVIEMGANIGVAFDGDGDRAMFIDETGHVIKSEYILGLLFQDLSGFFKKPKAVYDLRVSMSIKELLGNGGFKTRPGHSFVKKIMEERSADVGGELSGHFFFKEMHYAESSLIVMFKILNIITKSGKELSELVRPFDKYYSSGEVNMEIGDRNQIANIIQKLKSSYSDGELDETDGVTVQFWNRERGSRWWFNVRPSNTEPILRLVVEADTKELMESKVKELESQIK